MIGSKFYYETIINQARIQFFDDDTMISEWIAHNGDNPVIEVAGVSGATLYRKYWKEAEANIRRWIDGMKGAGIVFPTNQDPSRFSLEMKNIGSVIEFEYKVYDTSDAEYTLRQMEYIRNTDTIIISAQSAGATLKWIDYINFTHHKVDYERVVDDSFMAGL